MRARLRLANRLREIRGETTGQALALTMGWGPNGQSKVSKIERGAQQPSEADLLAWARATGTEARELLDLHQRALAEFAAVQELYDQAGGPAARQAVIGAEEDRARRIVMVEPNMIVPLLQTADYARAVIQPPPEFDADIPPAELTRTVAARLARQAVLFETGRDITLLMGEAALWDVASELDVHLRQLSHLAELIETGSDALIGIIPALIRSPFVVIGGYSMLDDVVTNETLGGSLDVTQPAAVSEYHAMTELLLGVAVTGADAALLVRAVRDRLQAAPDPYWWRATAH